MGFLFIRFYRLFVIRGVVIRYLFLLGFVLESFVGRFVEGRSGSGFLGVLFAMIEW